MALEWAKAPFKAVLHGIRSRIVAGERLRLDALEATFAEHQNAVAAWSREADRSTTGRLSSLERDLEELTRSHREVVRENEELKRLNHELTHSSDQLKQSSDELKQSSDELRGAHADLRQSFDSFQQAFYGLKHEFGALRQDADALKRTSGELGHANDVRTLMDWMPFASLTGTPLISIIMPTRNRLALLPRAIASVQAQSYPNWELLIVDDASTDETPEFLDSVRSDSIRIFRGPGKGPSAARNIGLAAARGEFVAYLDDDNIMHPQWLKTVAWGFEQWPQFDVVYGAFVIDNPARNGNEGGNELPYLFFRSYDHHSLVHGNVADMSAIAHRNGLPEARFDETLIGLGDWDLLLRLTRDKAPFPLPAIATFYTTDAPNRVTSGPTMVAEQPILQAKNWR